MSIEEIIRVSCNEPGCCEQVEFHDLAVVDTNWEELEEAGWLALDDYTHYCPGHRSAYELAELSDA